MTSLLPLPPVRAELPAWSERTAERWKALETRANVLATRAGTGRRFDALVDEARRMLEDGDPELLSRVSQRRFARAVVTVWAADPALAARTTTSDLLAALRPSTDRRPSRLTVVTTVLFLLKHYTVLDEWRPGLFAELAATIRAMVAASATGSDDTVETLRTQGSFLLDPQGPRTLARHLLSIGSTPHDWFRAHRLGAATDTRFFHLVRDAVYLVQIEDADPTIEGHAVLAQVRDEVLARQRSTQGQSDPDETRRFGHDVLTALLLKEVRRPATDWLDAVTTIAGDPRHRQTERWSLWWRPLDRRLVERAVRWMSTADLRAFLDAVEDYGRSQGNTDLTRMIAPRRIFLDGLYEADRIVETRLVLGSDVSRRVAGPARLSQYDAARYSETGGNDKAIIIVDCGEFTLVEGSHNFKLYVFAGRPVGRLMNRSERHFTLDDFRDRVPREHERLHGPERWTAISHQGLWQREAFNFLRYLGVSVQERTLVDERTHLAIQRRRASEGWY